MLHRIKSAVLPLAVAAGTALAPVAAFAQTTTTPLDVSAATAQLGEVSTSMLAIGGVLFGLAAIALGIKWVKATFFG